MLASMEKPRKRNRSCAPGSSSTTQGTFKDVKETAGKSKGATVQGVPNPVWAWGWHYAKWHQRGALRLPPSCWVWTGGFNRKEARCIHSSCQRWATEVEVFGSWKNESKERRWGDWKVTYKKRRKGRKAEVSFFLTDQGCKRGKTCNFSHDVKDEKRRFWNCGCPDHMSPACTRPKNSNDTSPQKPRLQKVEGEETSPSSPKTKEDEGGSEQASMKDFLEQTTI